MEHGSIFSGSWLTPKGKTVLAWMCEFDWDTVDEAGFPHYPDECTDTCWATIGVVA